MDTTQKWEYILNLDEELLTGGVVLSEWGSFLVRDADVAFCSNANLAAILTAQAAIEAHLRFEYFDPDESKGWGLYQLILQLEKCVGIEPDLIQNIHKIRLFRNSWVHVKDPSDDHHLLSEPELEEQDIENMAQLAIQTMRRVLYLEQWI